MQIDLKTSVLKYSGSHLVCQKAQSAADFVAGRWDVITAILTAYLLIFMVFFSTWAKVFPEEWDLLQKLCWMTVVGFILHFVSGTAVGRPFPHFDILPRASVLTRRTISIVGFGFSGVILMQFITITLLRIPPSVVSMQTIPHAFLGAAAGIAEEWIFAWGLFTFFYWLTMKRGYNLIPVLLVNGICFALFHSYVGFVSYAGHAEFLPTIFVSRNVIDVAYFISGGRLAVAMGIHILVDVTKSLIMLPVSAQIVLQVMPLLVMVPLCYKRGGIKYFK
jgi:hypothetical protein